MHHNAENAFVSIKHQKEKGFWGLLLADQIIAYQQGYKNESFWC